MRGFFNSALLAFRSLSRSGAFFLLVLAVGVIHSVVPFIVRSDGTESGENELFVRLVSTIVFSVVLVTCGVIGAGVFSREREEHRLQLSLVRRASAFSQVCGRWFAVSAMALVVLAMSAVITIACVPASRCNEVLSPVLVSPEEVAESKIVAFLADPKTPAEVKTMKRGEVIRMLAMREEAAYTAIKPGEATKWSFPAVDGDDLTVRVKVSNVYGLHTEVGLAFQYGNLKSIATNMTESVVFAKLHPAENEDKNLKRGELYLKNIGKEPFLLRQRMDVDLLVPSDSFMANQFRAMVEEWSVVAAMLALAILLSSSLSRPVAVFTLLVMMLSIVMSQGVVDRFPVAADLNAVDTFGLAISRGLTWFSGSLLSESPIADLSQGIRIGTEAMLRSCVWNAIAVPLALLACSAFLIRRKQ